MDIQKDKSNTKLQNSVKNPAQFKGKAWIEIFKRVATQIKKDNVQIVAAGVAFYFFLALFPAIAAIFSIYGLVVEPAQVSEQMSQIATFLPDQASGLISNILEKTAGKSQETLGWSLVLSILLSLWSSKKAISAVFEGVNIAYNESDDRGFIKKTAITLLFTIGGIILGILSIAFVLGFPAVVDKLNLPMVLEMVFAILRWVILAAIIMFSLALIYKIAPDRDNPKFRWVTWGTVLATVFWLGGSLLFTFYVNNFGNYDKTYGSIAAVIILLLWFFLTGFIILIGAEINSEMEHQTRADTTVGDPEPLGERGAFYADRVADKNK
ncbi:MAG TPA: YihY/virulence factor BrkB family protein [Prolixibacteraceae bacterium]|nr:YihY/virulence factor BrkB family protein [Prolixibacteraceae bacterium]